MTSINYKALFLAIGIMMAILGVGSLIVLWVHLFYKSVIISLSPIIIGGIILLYFFIKKEFKE